MQERILLLDDDVHFAAAMTRRLTRSGLDVQVLQSGQAALDWLAEHTVELMVLDFRLGDMTARELIARLPADRKPEFVVITAFGDERIAVDMMKQGARDYLMKDAAVFELLPVVISQALARIQQERRLAEVERSLRLLELAVSHAHDGIAVLSAEPTPRVLYANPAFQESMVAPVSFAALHDASAEEILPRLQRGEVSQRRVRRETAEGTARIVDSSLTPVPTETGALEHFIAVQRDVSHSARLEERIQQAQTMEAVGQLAGGVAHDFNNLLTVIMGHTSLSLQGPVQPEAVRSSLERIQQAASSGAQLVNQLLTVSRRQPLSPQVMDLNDIVREISRMLRRSIGARRLSDALHPEPLPVYVDPAQLQRVLLNLVVNARDATASGGSLCISTAPGAIPGQPAALPGDTRAYACLMVEDDGEGMSPDVQARIFEPFFTTKGPGEGTGLGLSTVYAIVQQSQGLIQVHSAPGQGTRFVIYLPLAEAPPPTEPPSLQQRTILLAEDDAVVRQLVRITLEQAGYQVLEASSGRAAQQTLIEQAGPVDMLISDICMPDLDGHMLARDARRLMPALPILLISGFYSGGGDELNLPLLLKPFTTAQLLESIQSLMP